MLFNSIDFLIFFPLVTAIYFATPYPLVRVRAVCDELPQLENYEAFTCLKEGSRLDAPQIDRGPDGKARYAWRKNTPAVGPSEQSKLITRNEIVPCFAVALANSTYEQPVAFGRHGEPQGGNTCVRLL